MKTTTYKPIANFAGYRVGDDGSVWSCRKRNYRKGFGRGVYYIVSDEWHQMKPSVQRSGYLEVQLWKDGKSCHKLVHRLVLEAFVGPCPAGMECRHFPDDTKSNCRLENLSWSSKKLNQGDRVAHGTHCRGERHGIAATTNEVAKKIRQRFMTVKNKAAIAREFGLSRTVVRRIIAKETYRE